MSESKTDVRTTEITTSSVSVEELQNFAGVCGLTQAELDRCSTIFLFQVYAGAFKSNVFGDAAKIWAEVKHLEGVGRPVGTRGAEQFKERTLLGLYKKHYLVGGLGSIGRNIFLGAGKKQKGFRQIIERHYNSKNTHLSVADISRNIASDVVKIYEKRSESQNLTGNWIVFAQHEGQNYYLCLATHEEGDDIVAARIKDGCFVEFPFLSAICNF